MLNWNGFDRSHKIYVWMAAIFVVSLVIANLTGAMLFSFELPFSYPIIRLDVQSSTALVFPWASIGIAWTNRVLLSAGIIPFPITFILTDLLNEFYGKQGARFITWIGFGMSLLTYILLTVGEQLPLDTKTQISKSVFLTISTQYTGMFIASLTAYLIGQMLDIQVFHVFRSVTKHRFIWLRATGSTVISQLFDSLIVSFIAFWGKMQPSDILHLALDNYTWKFLIALGITPLLYLGHMVLRKLMPRQEALVEAAAPEYRPE